MKCSALKQEVYGTLVFSGFNSIMKRGAKEFKRERMPRG